MSGEAEAKAADPRLVLGGSQKLCMVFYTSMTVSTTFVRPVYITRDTPGPNQSMPRLHLDRQWSLTGLEKLYKRVSTLFWPKSANPIGNVPQSGSPDAEETRRNVTMIQLP